MIKAERVKAGLLQSQLADKLGLAYRYVRVLERGFQRIPLKHVDALVAALPGLNAKKLRAAIEREANRVMLKNADAVQRLSGILDGNNGTVVVLGSLGADFPSQRMLEALNGFLQTEGNHVAFIVPPDDGNWAFGQDSGHGNVSALSIKLSCGNPCVARRVDFYSPVLPKYKRTAGQIQSLSQLLHPLTTTILFEPQGDSAARAGLVYVRTGLGKAAKGESVWLRPSSEFLGRLSAMLKATLWVKNRDSFLSGISKTLPEP